MQYRGTPLLVDTVFILHIKLFLYDWINQAIYVNCIVGVVGNFRRRQSSGLRRYSIQDSGFVLLKGRL